jgi:hypothetical protein
LRCMPCALSHSLKRKSQLIIAEYFEVFLIMSFFVSVFIRVNLCPIFREARDYR